MKIFNLAEISKRALTAAAVLGMLTSCIHKKYETPITKDTQQPDKVLFDKAMKDIERGQYEVARIELNTLMNTYESSEFLAKAKLALADSWFREGGANGMAQAEAEYKDFELFYPTMEESAEAQYKICMIHYKGMDKPDRDESQALRAEDECRNLLVQYPNSKHAPQAAQLLRNIQEVLGEHQFRIGTFYYEKGANPAAANRLTYAVEQYPLYSNADQALWEAGKAYLGMGPKYRQTAADAFSRIVREYPLSARAEEAKQQLEDMEMPIPQGDRNAYDRQKYDLDELQGPLADEPLRRFPASWSGREPLGAIGTTVDAGHGLPDSRERTQSEQRRNGREWRRRRHDRYTGWRGAGSFEAESIARRSPGRRSGGRRETAGRQRTDAYQS